MQWRQCQGHRQELSQHRSFSAPLSSLPNRCIFEQLQEPNANCAGGIIPSAHFLCYWMTAASSLSSCDWFLLDFDWNERVEDDFPVASQRKRPKLDG